MGKSRWKRLLSAFLCVCMVAMMAPAAFAAEQDATTVSTSEELVQAIAKANNGDTIKLGAGTFNTVGDTKYPKSLTFVGTGKDTVWTIGDLSKNVEAEANGDYTFDGADTITFKNMTLQVDNSNYRGFIRIHNTVVENCVLEGRTSYWGYTTATFKDSTFNAPEGSYALEDYSSPVMTFDGCTFNVSGKTVNVYVDESSDTARKVVMKNCTVNSTATSKSVLNIKNANQAWDVEISNTKVTGLAEDATTGSNLYQVEKTGSEGKALTVSVDGKTVWKNGAPFVEVAEVNGTAYSSLAEAVNAAKDGETVTLLKDTTVSNTINITNNLTLDLNGHVITAATKNSRMLWIAAPNVKLTIEGAVEGSGMTIGDTHAASKDEKVWGFVDCRNGSDGSIVTVNGGNYTGSTCASDNYNYGSMFVVRSDSTLVLNNVTAETDVNVVNVLGDTASKVTVNGGRFNITGIDAFLTAAFYTGAADAEFTNMKLTAKYGGCVQVANKATLTNCDIIVTDIRTGDGTHQNCAVAVQDAGEVTINGGTYSAPYGAYVYNSGGKLVFDGDATVSGTTAAVRADATTGKTATVEINSGKFSGTLVKGTDAGTKNITISGGLFNTEFDKSYCADNKACVGSGNEDYPFTVGDVVANVEVAPAEPAASADTNGKSEDVKTAMDNTVAAITGTDNKTEIIGMDAIGGNEAAKITADAVTAAGATLKSNNVSTENKTVTVYVQPYMDITVKDAVVDENSALTSVTLDIVPKVKKIASTADSADEINLPEDAGTTNAKLLEDKEVTVTTPVTLTIPLPSGFVTDNLKVKHEKNGKLVGYHDAAYNDTDNTITFTNDKGFSTFTVLSDARSASIQFTDKDGNNIGSAKSYGPSNVNDALPTTAAESGYVFNGWKFEDIDGVYTTLTDELLTKLAAKSGTVSATPDFSKRSSGSSSSGGSSSNTFKVTTSAVNNGGVNVSPSSAAKGATITITLSPDKGYKLDKLTVTDGSGKTISTTKKSDTVYTFTMPSSAVKVSVSYTKDDSAVVEPTTGFSDVAATAWYANAVKYAVDKGMMNGVGSNKFAPDGVTNRGMIVTVLYRLENEPTASAASFTDVVSGAYYANAVAWASANGIVTGYGNGKFGPNDSITREQFAAILYRYAQYKKYDVSAAASLDGYTDAQSVSSYAVPAVQWACGAGVMNGSNGRLTPKSGATRAQAAQLLMNFCENAAK